MKFSIVAPILNEEKYIAETIENIQSQGMDFEFIMMDGGSTDRTHEMVKNINDSRVVLDIRPDVHLVARINEGLAQMTGDIFIMWCGHDRFEKDAFKTIVDKGYLDDHTWIVGGMRKIDERNNVIKTIYKPRLSYPFIRTDFIKQHSLKFSLKYIQNDYDFYMRIWKMIGEPFRVPEIFCQNRIHKGQLSEKYKHRMRSEVKEINRLYT